MGQSYPRKADRGYFAPVLSRPDPDDGRLSFVNVIEAHVVRALRTVHEVDLEVIREAVAIAENQLGIPRILLDPRLKASGGQLFLDRLTDLVQLSASQQIAMRMILEMYMERVEYDESNLPTEFSPFEKLPENSGRKVITLNPFVTFGRPVIRRVGVSTRAIVQRLDAGESSAEIISDYELTEAELEEAILFEAAA